MQLTAELASLGYAHRETEFIIAPAGSPVAGQRIYGACGPTALASAASAALQRLVTSESAYTVMQSRGLCDAQGVTNDGKIATAAAAFGLTIAARHGYANTDIWNGWQTFLGWHLGSCDHPTVIELAHGQNLHDEMSGQGENATGLTYHFMLLLKRHAGGYSAYAGKTLPSGYWACDGDNYAGGNSRANNFAATDTLQFYSDATLTAAMPCAAVAFDRISGGGTVAGVPAVSWSDDNTTLTAPNRQTCGHGIRAHILGESWPAELWPIAGEEGDVAGVHQDFRNGGDANAAGRRLTWHSAGGAITESALASPAVELQSQLEAALAEIATLKAQPASPPIVEPVPAPLTPQQQAAIELVASLRAALA